MRLAKRVVVIWVYPVVYGELRSSVNEHGVVGGRWTHVLIGLTAVVEGFKVKKVAFLVHLVQLKAQAGIS